MDAPRSTGFEAFSSRSECPPTMQRRWTIKQVSELSDNKSQSQTRQPSGSALIDLLSIFLSLLLLILSRSVFLLTERVRLPNFLAARKKSSHRTVARAGVGHRPSLYTFPLPNPCGQKAALPTATTPAETGPSPEWGGKKVPFARDGGRSGARSVAARPSAQGGRASTHTSILCKQPLSPCITANPGPLPSPAERRLHCSRWRAPASVCSCSNPLVAVSSALIGEKKM